MMMISMLASVSSSCLCLSILCVLLVFMNRFGMAEKHCYQWTNSLVNLVLIKKMYIVKLIIEAVALCILVLMK